MTSLALEPILADRARAWGRAADISARSALVTILGDTIAPLGGSAWLADVIVLAQPFGFSDRLIRTSMFRLVAEGWVVSERHGRRSRYALTEHGREETRVAERRIYRPEARTWDGSWTLVFLGAGSTGNRGAEAAPIDDLARHLRWRGFAPMADGVHAHPNDSVAETRQLLERLGVQPAPPIAAARFDGDGEAPIVGPGFRDESGLAEAEAAYHRFLDRYEPVEPSAELAPIDAFALRTMVVHDLRRARLRDPDLPTALLPTDWVGRRAVELASRLYRSIDEPAWSWVEEVTGSTVQDEDLVAARFTPDESATPTNTEEGSP